MVIDSRGHVGKLAAGVGWRAALISAVFLTDCSTTKASVAMTSEHFTWKGRSLVRSENGRKP